MDLLRAIAIGVLFGIALYQLLRRNVIRIAIGLVILSNAVNLFLLSVGAYNGVVEAYAKAVGQRSDALPQALILTAIVISMGGFSMMLALLYVIASRYRTGDSDEVRGLSH
ncbi:MAG: sodium:proton antiporter [Anaerolineae bacterium]|nr:sodium:proton antiporter [Thermoflexales bacterium]MDW8406628.1 sodium:proton antiporter [Anaerolineae bacterium]